MFITKKSIPRRTFLRGMGVTLALPLFDSMLPAQTPLSKTAATPKMRAGFLYMQHGAIMKDFTPDKEGRNFDLKRILKPYFTTKDRGDETRGFGLGLAICRQIVHLHGGNLNIASEERKGTTVQVDLPSRQINRHAPAVALSHS